MDSGHENWEVGRLHMHLECGVNQGMVQEEVLIKKSARPLFLMNCEHEADNYFKSRPYYAKCCDTDNVHIIT